MLKELCQETKFFEGLKNQISTLCICADGSSIQEAACDSVDASTKRPPPVFILSIKSSINDRFQSK
jgi:hypothetical protein